MTISGTTMDLATVTYCWDGERLLPWAFIDLDGAAQTTGTQYVLPLPPSLPTINPVGAGVVGVGVALASSQIRRQSMRFAAFPDALYAAPRVSGDPPGDLAVQFFGGV